MAGPGWEPPTRLAYRAGADQRDGFDQVRPGHQRPTDALVPAQHVAGEIQQHRQHEQAHPEQVIETARRQVRAGKDHPQQVQQATITRNCAAQKCRLRTSPPNGTRKVSVWIEMGGLVGRRDVIEDLQDAGDQPSTSTRKTASPPAARV